MLRSIYLQKKTANLTYFTFNERLKIYIGLLIVPLRNQMYLKNIFTYLKTVGDSG